MTEHGSAAPRTGGPPADVPIDLYRDGLVDSRSTSSAAGIERLVRAPDAGERGGPVDVDDVVDACRDDDSTDDVTLLVLSREPGPAVVPAVAGAA